MDTRNSFLEINEWSGEYFPDHFAVELATEVDLHPMSDKLKYRGKKVDRAERKVKRLKWFQEASVSGEFETAIKAYTGFELDDEQMDVLKIIYEFTSSQICGKLANVIFEKVRKTIDAKELKSLGELLLMLRTGNEKEKASAETRIKSLVIETTTGN